VQTNLVAIREYLRRRGVSCPVINITRHRKREADDVYYPDSALGVLKLLTQLKPDIVHLHFGGRLSIRLLGLAFACTALPATKCVLTMHSGGYPESEEAKSPGRRALAGLVLRRLDCVIVVNQALAAAFTHLGIRAERLRLIEPSSFDLSVVATELPAEIGRFADTHAPLLTTVGLLEPEYDLPLQIEAVGHLRERLPGVGLVIIGSGSLESRLRDLLQRTAHRAHVLLAGDVPHGATLLTIRNSAAFLRTTHYDGDSVAVREALHLGVPVVATDNGMRPAGVTLVAAGDCNALVEAVAAVATTSPTERLTKLPSSADDANLRAVFDLYRELTGAADGTGS
jgi:glycosyltransferase involved in cell wall biosynthesis